ncbi:MAG: PGPGW domain-containing protein [Planctomycetota bacterium]
MGEWLAAHQAWFWWLTVASFATIPIAILLLPFAVELLPVDYFVTPSRHRVRYRHPAVAVTLWLLRNLLGWVLVLAGIIMLLLPGQGMLAIVVGLTLVEFPGKFRLERWLVRKGPILRLLNWLRARRHAPPLLAPVDPDAG